MTKITLQDGKVVLHDGKVGVGKACCCDTTPCDPCMVGTEISFPTARLVGTWDTGFPGGPVAFDWLAPGGQVYTGYVNRGWQNNSRPTVGQASAAPDTRVNATVWRWDGSTETCNTYDPDNGSPDNNFIVEATVPALRTCWVGESCHAWRFAEYEPGGPLPVLGGREYRTLIANPPPDDGQWYTFIYIEAIIGGPLVWYWAWIPYCTQTCGEVALSSDGLSPDSLVIDTFTLTCERADACCAGNDEYPIYKLVGSECEGGHHNVDYSAQTIASDVPPCLGACCYNDGTADVCDGPMSKAQCDALSGTWHSGKSCAPDQQIVTLSFSSTKFGSGGGGIATAPVGTPGPITAVSIASPGSGYAQVVRAVPSLTASVSGGTGATLSVSLAANGTTPQTWGVSGVTVTGTTSGYTDGTAVAFSYGGDVTEQTKATATIKTTRTAPTITASVTGGSGASLSVSLSQSPTTPSDTALWHVASVSVTAAGSGYTDGDAVTFTVTDGTQVAAASGTITTAQTRGNPNLTPYVWGDDGTTAGSGAIVTATMNETTDWDGKPAWEVSALSIVNGGSGYEVGEYFWYEELDPGIGNDPPYYVLQVDGWWITSVDGNGAITGIGLDPNGGTNGLFYKDTSIGAIQSISVTSGGDYYKAGSAISRVVVNDAGKYYREEVSVADVTVTISQAAGYNGTGASITATVDSDKTSATFGQVTALTIANGGSGYVAVVPADDPCNLFP